MVFSKNKKFSYILFFPVNIIKIKMSNNPYELIFQ